MKVSPDRIVAIIACMYGKNVEIVNDIEYKECYIFFDKSHDLPLTYEEVNCLVHNEIIELDCGCDEEGHETEVYRLTEDSQKRIQEIIKNKKMLLLKE